MSDTDSISFVPGQNAILRKAIGNAPAKENPLTISLGNAIAEERALGAASRMEAEVGVIYCLAVMKLDIIADLEAETISIVVSGNNVLESPAVAILDEDSTGEVAVDVLVVITVAVEHYVPDNNIVHVFSSKDWKNSRSGGIFIYPKVLFGQPV